MVSGRRDFWFPLLTLGNTDPLSFTYLCINVDCKLPAMVNNSYFVSTTYQNSWFQKTINTVPDPVLLLVIDTVT